MCHCAELGGWGPRHELDPGAKRLTQLEQIFYDDHSWERIYRCKDCQQLWHEEISGGHASIEHIRKVDAKAAAKITKELLRDKDARNAAEALEVAARMARHAENAAARPVLTSFETKSSDGWWARIAKLFAPPPAR